MRAPPLWQVPIASGSSSRFFGHAAFAPGSTTAQPGPLHAPVHATPAAKPACAPLRGVCPTGLPPRCQSPQEPEGTSRSTCRLKAPLANARCARDGPRNPRASPRNTAQSCSQSLKKARPHTEGCPRAPRGVRTAVPRPVTATPRARPQPHPEQRASSGWTTPGAPKTPDAIPQEPEA